MTQKSLTFDECKQLSSRIIAMNPNRRANMGHFIPSPRLLHRTHQAALARTACWSDP